jgi:hypothetical protein
MTGELATPVRVIIHGWQVVMNHGISVNILQSTGGGKHRRRIAANGLCGGQEQNRPEAFATGKYAIAHGLHEQRRVTAYRRQKGVEACFHALALPV